MKENQICYYIENDCTNHMSIGYGVYEGKTIISGTNVVSRLKPYETRLINGIPFDDFVSETKFKKLPKDWSYNTELWKTTYDKKKIERFNKVSKGMKYINAKDIQWLYDNGYLVKMEDVEPRIKAEFDHETYKIIKKIPCWTIVYGQHNNRYVDKIFETYEEAIEELERLKELRYKNHIYNALLDFYEDLDWILERYEKDHGGKNLDSIRKKLLSRPHKEDIMFRYYKSEILVCSREKHNKESYVEWEKIA